MNFIFKFVSTKNLASRIMSSTAAHSSADGMGHQTVHVHYSCTLLLKGNYVLISLQLCTEIFQKVFKLLETLRYREAEDNE